MLKDYPYYTFTPEKPELTISLNTGMKLTLKKFASNNDLDFISVPSLGFQVQIGDKQYDVKFFQNFVTARQKNHQVIELNMPFSVQEKCIAKIKIVNMKEYYDYAISMQYDIQPLEA